MGPAGWVSDEYVGDAPGAVIHRKAGQDVGGEARKPSMSDAEQENLAMLHRNVSLPATGDAGQHLKEHAAFMWTPLGRAMPRYAQEKLRDHMLAHVASCFPDGDREDDFHRAANLAKMSMEYGKGGY